MPTWSDIAGQTLTPLDGSWRGVLAPERFDAEAAWEATTRAAMDERWSALRRENPRFHDGPLLVVAGIDEAERVIRVVRGTFKPMAVQGAGLELGYFGLGVKGLVTGRDRAGAEHVLIARRGTGTRIYQGLWEIAPAGGIEPPADGVSFDLHAAAHAALVEEGREELGVDLSAAAKSVVAVVRDGVAHSCDVIVRVEWPGVVNPRAGVCRAGGSDWEYLDAAWLARDEAPAFDREHAAEIVGPARAALRWQGWTGARPLA